MELLSQWISSSLPRDLLDYVSFVPSPSDPIPVSASHSGRGRGRGRGRSLTSISRGIGRGVSRGGRVTTSAADVCSLNTDIIASDQEHSAEHAADMYMDVEINEQEGEEGDESRLCDDMFDNEDTNGDAEEMIDAVIESADSSATAIVADSISMDASGNSIIDLPISNSPVFIQRSHPLFGLWTGSFDVRGVNGTTKCAVK